MLTSLSLSYLGIYGGDERLFEDGLIEEATIPETSVFEELGTVPADAPESAPKATPEEAPAS
jgi:hypothetical protein